MTTARRTLSTPKAVLIVTVIAALILGFLAVRALGNAVVYFHTVDEAVAKRDQLGTSRFRLEGCVQPGVEQGENFVTFVVAGNESQITVTHNGSPPELFEPGIPVVVEGNFEGENFRSDRIMVKHSAEYVQENDERVQNSQEFCSAEM